MLKITNSKYNSYFLQGVPENNLKMEIMEIFQMQDKIWNLQRVFQMGESNI